MSTASQRVGVIGHTAFHADATLENNNAGFHNSLYRGKYLGSSVSADQYAEISAGTFDDLFIGDYWTINGVNYRIAAFDYWLHDGDTECTAHHVVIVPDTNLATDKMDSSNFTEDGYVGSGMYKGTNKDGTTNSGLSTAKSLINTAFGSAHILNHREYLVNKATGGYASAGSWYDSTVELMNEAMVYGNHPFESTVSGTNVPANYTIDKTQLPLFQHEPSRICNRAYWWLRSVVSSTHFALVGTSGLCAYYNASNSIGVRPAFAIRA